MTSAQPLSRPLRLWPGVAAVAIQWAVRFGVPVFAPDAAATAIIGGMAGGAAVLAWWLLFSRAPWVERIGALVLILAAVFAASRVAHPSIATGMMGMLLPIYATPFLSLALVAWAALTRGVPGIARGVSLVAAIAAACGIFTLLRTGGMTGDAASDFHWRWTPTPEQRLVAAPVNAPIPVATTPAAVAPPVPVAVPKSAPAVVAKEALAAWPGFRGPQRDGIVRGVSIATDWSATPPVALWRKPVGPGWSSFAVRGDRIYTQEQRGDDEVVACYDFKTGEAVWRHGDKARFWESNGGAGPRGTPEIRGGRVYALGATGILNALDAGNGSVLWSRNAAEDTKAKIPGWGFAGSPLVVDGLAVVATSGALAAYDAVSGEKRWVNTEGRGGYSSPHLAAIDGTVQILLANGAGAIGVSPADGALLWKHEWPGDGIVQPALIGGDVLLGSGSGMGSGMGMRRAGVSRGPDGWKAEERWTSTGLKPYFNDFVVHDGHAFGFDGSILACIDLADGKRRWKGGRYGHGQLLLLAEQGLLLVLSEEGELALVRATPAQFEEVARAPAIAGKTWNHPVLAGDVLLVRNAEEMAAFQLPGVRR